MLLPMQEIEIENTGAWVPVHEPENATSAALSEQDWPRWAAPYLVALAASGVVSAAAAAAGIDRATAYRLRERSPEFAEKWSQAMESAIDRAESELYRRAVHGVEKPVFYCGVKCGTIREYSDALLKFYLSSRRRSVFGDQVAHEISGPGGAPIPLQLQQAIDKVYGEVVDVTAEPAAPQLPLPGDAQPEPSADPGAEQGT